MNSIASSFLCLLVLIIFLVALFFGAVLNRVPENEKWVVTRLGRIFVKEPGIYLQIPLVDQIIKVDMREESTKILDQACITKDMAPVSIDLIIYSCAIEPIKYSSLTKRLRDDFVLLSTSTLKEIVSTRMLDEVFSNREKLGSAICEKLNSEIDSDLGMKIERVKIVDINVSKDVLASMAISTANERSSKIFSQADPGIALAKNVPARCPGCGASILIQVAKGTDFIKCEYCGYSIRL